MFENLNAADWLSIATTVFAITGGALKAISVMRRQAFTASLTSYPILIDDSVGLADSPSNVGKYLVALSVERLSPEEPKLEFVVTISGGQFDLKRSMGLPFHVAFIPFDEGSEPFLISSPSIPANYHVNHQDLAKKASLGEDELQTITFGVVVPKCAFTTPILRVYSCVSVCGFSFRNILSMKELPIVKHHDVADTATTPTRPPA